MRLRWRFGARQLTIGGWLTVVLYIMAVVICWDASGSTGLTAQEWKVWRSIALVFGGLGISKQLNLLTALTEFGRTAAHFGGWYHRRQIVQTEFVRGIVVSCAAITLTVIGWARTASWACWLAVIVTAVVLGFVLGTVRNLVFEAILMKFEGASNGYREGSIGSATCRA
jgi:hypothetical protein